MRAAVNTALSALLMLLLAVSSANATTCLRVSDNKQFELKFKRVQDQAITSPSRGVEFWLSADDSAHRAMIMELTSYQLYATDILWFAEGVITTYSFDRIKRRIQVFESRLRHGYNTIKVDEFLCTKPQN